MRTFLPRSENLRFQLEVMSDGAPLEPRMASAGITPIMVSAARNGFPFPLDHAEAFARFCGVELTFLFEEIGVPQ